MKKTILIIFFITLLMSCQGFAGRTSSSAFDLESIDNTKWILNSWALDDSAPGEPAVTLMYQDGKFIGNAGCNNYFSSVAPGEEPGEINIGPIAATEMYCMGPAMQIEQRYLKLLLLRSQAQHGP